MKVYIIHNSQSLSIKYATECYESFSTFNNWEPFLFNGCNPDTLDEYQDRYNLTNKRAKCPKERYKSKKSCFYSHYELWNLAVNLNEKIAIVEHDTYCIGDMPESLEFTGALQLSVESAAREKLYKIWINDYHRLMSRKDGIHTLDICRKIEGHTPLIANMAYAITPNAASILIEDCKKNGWLQNDNLITSKYFDIEYLLPSVIKYDKSKELGTSINYENGE